MSAGATADTATQPQQSDQLRRCQPQRISHIENILKEINTMEKILFKFMRAKYNEAVKTGKVRGQLAEYIRYGDWLLEINFSTEEIRVLTPTRNIVHSIDLFEAVLDAILTGDTTYINKLVSAVKIANNRWVKIRGAEGDIKITDAYF